MIYPPHLMQVEMEIPIPPIFRVSMPPLEYKEAIGALLSALLGSWHPWRQTEGDSMRVTNQNCLIVA